MSSNPWITEVEAIKRHTRATCHSLWPRAWAAV